MSTVNAALLKWLREQGEDLTDTGLITHVKLFMAGLGGSQELKMFRTAEGELPHVAQAVWDIAEREVATLPDTGGAQRFVVCTYRGDPDSEEEENPFEGRFPFVIQSKADDVDPVTGVNSVPATEAGLLQSLMRHTNEQQRINMLLQTSSLGRLENECQRLTEMNRMYENRHFQNLALQEDLSDRKMERELRRASEEMKAKRIDQVTGMVMTFVPLLMSGATGIKSSATVATTRDMGVGNMLKGLSQEEFYGIYNSLTPQNQLLFAELYKSYRDQNARDQEQKPEVLRDKVEPN